MRRFDNAPDHWQTCSQLGEPMKTVKLASMGGTGKATVEALEAERDRLRKQIAEANEKLEKRQARRARRKPKARKRA
jgi:hypothetical protein